MAFETQRRMLANRAATWLLRSPLSRLLDGVLMLITVRGRRSGTDFTFPVQYATDGTALWVLPGNHEHKTWWRNLIAERPVRLRLRGRVVDATAQAMLGTAAPAAVEAGLLAYFRRYPKLARRFHIVGNRGCIDPDLLRDLAKRSVIVRIVPIDASILVADEAARAHRRPHRMLARIRRHTVPAFYALTQVAIVWALLRARKWRRPDHSASLAGRPREVPLSA